MGGTWKGAQLPGTVKDEWRALEMEHLSLGGLCEGNLEGGLLYWGPQRICQVRRWKWASCFHWGPILGNIEGRSFVGAFERRKSRLWKWVTVSKGVPVGEPGVGSFTGTFKRQMKESSGNRASLINLIWVVFFLGIEIMLGA